MRLFIIIFSHFLLFFWVGCSQQNKLIQTKLANSINERVIVENELFKVFLPETKVLQYLKKVKGKAEKDKFETLDILRDSDTLRIELLESNLKANKSIQLEIYPILVKLLKTGEATVFNKKKNSIEELVSFYHIKESLVGEQINFSIDDIRLFTYVVSFGE